MHPFVRASSKVVCSIILLMTLYVAGHGGLFFFAALPGFLAALIFFTPFRRWFFDFIGVPISAKASVVSVILLLGFMAALSASFTKSDKAMSSIEEKGKKRTEAVAYFQNHKDEILREGRSFLEQGKNKQAMALAKKYAPANDPDLIQFRKDAQSAVTLEKERRNKEIVAQRDKAIEEERQEKEKLISGLILDYRGKVVSIDKLDSSTCWVQINPNLPQSSIISVCENLGYYLQNASGGKYRPSVHMFVGGTHIAVARPGSRGYSAELDVQRWQ